MADFTPCDKQEAVNALRNAAYTVSDSMDVTKKEHRMVSFMLKGASDECRQRLERALFNVIRCAEVGWTDHPKGYNLVLSLGPRVLFYKASKGNA